MMKNILNAHALQSLLKSPDMPNINLAVADDEKHTSIPLLLFTEHHLPVAKPDIQPLNQLPFERLQKPGTGAVLSMDDFETENFGLGNPFGGEY